MGVDKHFRKQFGIYCGMVILQSCPVSACCKNRSNASCSSVMLKIELRTLVTPVGKIFVIMPMGNKKNRISKEDTQMHFFSLAFIGTNLVLYTGLVTDMKVCNSSIVQLSQELIMGINEFATVPGFVFVSNFYVLVVCLYTFKKTARPWSIYTFMEAVLGYNSKRSCKETG